MQHVRHSSYLGRKCAWVTPLVAACTSPPLPFYPCVHSPTPTSFKLLPRVVRIFHARLGTSLLCIKAQWIPQPRRQDDIARPWFRQKPGSRPVFSRSRTSPNLAAAHGPAPVQATWQIRSHKGPRRAVRNFSLGPASGWYFHLFCRPAPGE